MAGEKGGMDWVQPAYRHQASFQLQHYNQKSTSVDEESIKLSGIKPSDVPWWTSQRLRLSVLCFMGFACLNAQRVNLSIAIVCMVNDTRTEEHLLTTPRHPVSTMSPSAFSHANTYNESEQCSLQVAGVSMEGEFAWDKLLQGLLLGAFFWGYLVVQIPGVWLSETFGAKKVIVAGMFPVAILNVLTPPAARASPYLLLVVRIIVGLGEGVFYPASQTLWAKWAPPWERGILLGIALSGEQFGNTFMFPLGGILCKYGFGGGWPSMFYIIGSIGVLWSVLWMIFAHDSPESTPNISDVERRYIRHSLVDRKKHPKNDKTPWKCIFSSGPVWSIIIVHMCANFGMYMLLTQIPSYMKEVLKFGIVSNGLLSMLPYLCFWLSIVLAGKFADLLLFRKVFSVTWVRKVLSLIGMVGPAVCLIAVAYMDCTHTAAAVVLLCGAVGLSGFNFSGYFINHCDIAPSFAGTLFGVTNTAATIPGILAPYIVSAVTPNSNSVEWQTAFHICAGVYIFGALVYMVFGTGKPRAWAKPHKSVEEGVSLRKPIVNGHRKSRSSVRNTYFDNEESHVTIECDPAESYAESAIV